MAQSVAINVGVNTKKKCGGFRGPIFPDGTFKFIHIPWQKKYGKIEPEPKKYSEMCYAQYVLSEMSDKRVFISPDFCNCTYASTTLAPANKAINDLKPGDFLFFYATLDPIDDGRSPEDWINQQWGAYIVGLFKIGSIYESFRFVKADEIARKGFKEYAWFKSLSNKGQKDDKAPWIKGIEEESGLLKKAVPLSSPESGQKRSALAYDLFRTSRGKKLTLKTLIYRTILTCEGERLDTLLDLCVLRKKCRSKNSRPKKREITR